MLLEIQIAVSFLTSYLYNKLPRRRVDLFSVELTKQLREKFEGHWYPERPMKGSGFRCLSIGDELDSVIMNASRDSGLSLEEIRSSLPDKLTMWIDPDEVSYRIEEELVVKVIYQKDKYGETGNLAELEALGNGQLYNHSMSSPTRNSQYAEVQTSSSKISPQQISPLSMLANPHYTLWGSHKNNVDTPVHSRLSPNAEEFRYPISKNPLSTTNGLYCSDVTGYSDISRYTWSNSSDPLDLKQGYSFKAAYTSFFDNSNTYKRNYNPSQLEVMA